MSKLSRGRLQERKATYAEIHHPVTKSLLDKGIIIYFPSCFLFLAQVVHITYYLSYSEEHSMTGEDVVEMQLHASAFVIESVLEALSTLSSFRLSLPGEFTKRCLDTTQYQK